MTARRSLRAHLMLLYVLLAVLSGIIVPLVSIRITLQEFREYFLEKRKDDVEKLADSLVALYQEDRTWNEQRVRDVLRQVSRISTASLALYDTDRRLIFPTWGHGRRMMQNIQETMKRYPFLSADSPVGSSTGDDVDLSSGINRIALTLEGQNIGTLFVNLPPFPGKNELLFAKRIGHLAFVGAIFMIVLACALGFAVAGGLSRPVLRAAERARSISRGEYETRPEKPSGIREMDALSESVEELGRSLDGQEKLRKRLMIDIAHELRTPLTVIRSQLEALADGVWEASPERLGLCVAEIERLSELISEVERLSDLEGETLSLQTEIKDLGALLAAIIESFRQLFARSGIALTGRLAENVRISIDPGRFRHVIENLLSNALRYTGPGGTVEVRLDTLGESARIEVEDSGAGIAPSDLPHIFDRFYRSDASRTRGTGGRGVGLAIAKASIEAHGGSISVRSTPGKGSVFTVLLPGR